MTAAASEAIEDIYSLTPLQRGMLAHRLQEPAARAYFVQARLRIEGRLDVDRFVESWQRLVDRHPALRTFFVWEGVEEPVQVVLPSGSVKVPFLYRDFGDLSVERRTREIEEFLEQDYEKPFDLARAPLFRVSLLRTGDEHWCVWSHEHLILDGWCLPLLLHELLEIYDAGERYHGSALGAVVPFKRHIAWLSKQDRRAAEEYWHRTLAQVTTPTPLPWRTQPPIGAGSSNQGSPFAKSSAIASVPASTELVAPARPEPTHAERAVFIDESATARLERFAQDAGVTLNTVVQGAWAQVLSRRSGHSRVVFGVTTSGRPADIEAAEKIVGPCINTLPLVVSAAPWRRLRPWLRELQEKNLDLRRYGYVGLSEIARSVGTERDELGPPRLFDSVLVFENYPTRPLVSRQSGSLAISALGASAETHRASERSAERNNFPLTLVAAPGSRLLLMLAFKKRDFLQDNIDRLLEEVVSTLTAFAASSGEDECDHNRASGVPLGMLPPAGAPDLVGWHSGNDSWRTNDYTVVARFLRRAAAQPHRVAVVAQDGGLTYGELDRRSAAVARYLRNKVSGDEHPVVVSADKSSDAVVALVGVLRAGASFVPADPDWPRARRELVVRDSGARIVLTTGPNPTWDDLSEDCTEVDVGQLWRRWLNEGDALEWPDESDSTGIAYIIYTSGSSGRPKGVAVSHRALAHYADGVGERLGFEPGLNFALVSAWTADLGHTSTFSSLSSGGTLHVLSPDVALSGDAFRAYNAEHRIDVVKVAPSQMRLLLEGDDPGGVLPRSHLILGGESIEGQLVHQLAGLIRTRSPSCQLTNHYGPTEATVGAFCETPVAPEPTVPESECAPPIGKPLPGVTATITDPYGRALPAGVPGELCLGGPGVALGYLGRPGLTAERFIPDPSGRSAGGRLYRTGDRVRLLDHGSVEFLGRTDRQLNLRGQRIEPEEIASALRGHPAVRDAAIKLVDIAGEPQLVAYWLAVEGQRSTEERLRAHLGTLVPGPLVPSRFVQVDAWPLLGSGKVDIRALPDPGAAAHSFAAPRTEVERVLCEIWQHVLKRERVGIRDSFFELGGDSIRGLQLVARARRRGLRFTPKQVFEAPTIAQLAKLVGDSAEAERYAMASADSEPSSIDFETPLTPIQRWFFEARHPRPNHFNQALLLRVPEGGSVERISRVVHELVRHHEALRLRFFATRSGLRRQKLSPPPTEAPLTVSDLSPLSAPEQRAAIELRSAEVQEELDVEHGPVFRAVWFECGGAQPNRLLLTAHHLVVDAVSWRVLLDDLCALWRKESLPADTCSYLVWATELARAAQNPALLDELPYWLGARANPLPKDVDQPPLPTNGTARRIRRTLPPLVTRDLLERALPSSHASTDDLVLTAVACAFQQVWGLEEVVIECEGHGREHPDIDLDLSRSVGWFTARYPLKLDTRGIEKLDDCLDRVRELRRAVPGHGVGYGLLRYAREGSDAGLDSLRDAPDPEVCFNNLGYLDAIEAPGAGFEQAPERIENLRHVGSRRSQVIDITVSVSGGVLSIEWTHDPAIHHPDAIARLAGVALANLRALVEHCVTLPRAQQGAVDVGGIGLSSAQLSELGLDDREVDDIYRCSPLQEGLLFHDRLERGSYVNQLSLEVSGLNVGAFERAWKALLARHAILRTSFLWERPSDRVGVSRPQALSHPLQVVRRGVDLPLRLVDLQGMTEAELEKQWARELVEDRERGYDLREAPLWRVVVARIGQGPSGRERCRLLWSRHHILLDGWSSSRLLGELLRLYEGEVSGRAVSLGVAPPYRKYIQWLGGVRPKQRERLLGEAIGWLRRSYAAAATGRTNSRSRQESGTRAVR